MNDITALAQREMEQREKFEAWTEESCALPWGYLKKRRTYDGFYSEHTYTSLWAAWKAASMALVEALEARDKQIAELTSSESQAIAWESTTPVYIKFITDERYRKLSRKMQDWYVPYRCSHCAAGIQVIEGEA